MSDTKSEQSVQEVASEGAGDTTKRNGNGHKVDAYLIPFSKIEISKWNRSCGIPADTGYIAELAADIKRNGLLHPVTLVKTADGDGYRIVAGANRVAALRKMRGDDSGLKQTEFKVRDDMDESNEKCLAVSLAENHHRRASSVYEMALYVKRLIDSEKVKDGVLGRMLGLPRATVNRLKKLATCYDALPESWRQELAKSPTTAPSSGIVISFTHWGETASVIEDGTVTPEIAAVLHEAYEQRWSTRQLRSEIRKVIDGSPNVGSAEAASGAGQPAADASDSPKTKANPVEILKTAVRYLRQAGEALRPERAGDADDLVEYADAVDAIVKKLSATRKANKATKKAAEKAAEKAAKEDAKKNQDQQNAA